jgi:hypothetical protein
MIQKVSNQNKLPWVEQDSAVRHEGISKSAMDSFTESLVKQAKEMKSKGSSWEQIASKFNLSVDTLKGIIEAAAQPQTKLASLDKCDDKCEARSVEAREKGAYLSEAEKAYAALRGTTAALPKDFVPSSKRILTANGGRTDVTDFGGPRRQVNSSVWYEDAEKYVDNGERIRETNKKIAKQREENKYASRYHTIDGEDLADALKETDLRKDVGVQRLSGHEASNYNRKIPVGGMSIFETEAFGGKGDFSHIEKTEGEALADRRKAEAASKKDNGRTWVEDAQKRQASNTANSTFGQMIDSLLTGKKE